MTYSPLYIKKMETGLVQSRQNFILPDDAYPVLQNAFVWRERIKRKQGYKLLGRLRRKFLAQSLGNSEASPWSFNIFLGLGLKGNITNITRANPGNVTSPGYGLVTGTSIIISNVAGMTEINGRTFSITAAGANNFTLGASTIPFSAYTSGGIWSLASQANAEIECGSVVITFGGITFTDQGNGLLTSVTPGNSGTINYITGQVVLTHTAGAGIAATANFNYFPSLPVMGTRTREVVAINDEQSVTWDQVYAYIFQSGGWQEFISGTTWTGTNSDFFWTTNYWITPTTSPQPNKKVFWATNFSGVTGDPIRYTEGTIWEDFAPAINAGGDKLNQCLALLPFRGRLVAFNTLEGAALGSSSAFTNRIRWAAIGTPITTVSVLFPAGVNADAWKDDVRGQGGFLDIPTNEDITAVGFVRDNLVIYCERSTWQLRYTGRTIAPFQIEKVNSELGSESTFSAVQFDTSLVGIGDKGIVECDSISSQRIDIKIPDLVFEFNNSNNGTKRVHGIRDFVQRIAYWTYPDPADSPGLIFPNRRLVYNYENDSWATFTDSLTTLGTFQPSESQKWQDVNQPWISQTYPWVSQPALIPLIIGGNQQGYVLILDKQETNDVSLSITAITGNTTTSTVITSPNHNLETGDVIKISGIPSTSPFATSLNNNKFSVVRVDANNFSLWVYNAVSGAFDIPQLDAPGAYVGCGQISVRDNFSIVSKKFNFLDQGQNIQMGYLDILLSDTKSGAITLNAYLNYNDNAPINQSPQNGNPPLSLGDSFFNTVIPTTSSGGLKGSKNFQRVFCPVRGAFITLEFTLSNAQMVGVEQESDVQIDAQILWIRKAGRLQTGDI